MMQPGMQPPTPEQMEMLQKPSWEQVIGLLKNNVHRSYRIDIETDSTIAGSLESDMQGLQQVLAGITQFIVGVGPAVQVGAWPVEAVKEIVMTIARRARMGMSVEDALDKIQPPQAQADPKAQAEQAKAQSAMQLEQMRASMEEKSKQQDLAMDERRMQMEARFEEQRSQNEMRLAQAEQAYQAQQDAQAQQLEHEREIQRQAYEAQAAQMQQQMDERMEAMRQQFEDAMNARDNATKIDVAEIGANTALQSAHISAANKPNSEGE